MVELIKGKRNTTIFALVVLALLVVVSTAWADQITGYFRQVGPGQNVTGTMNEHTSTEWAGTLISEIDGTEVGTFCTDIEHPIYYDEAFVYEGPATCRVAWLANNYPPLFDGDPYPDDPPTTPLPDWDDEMAARQSAVWYFSDGFVLEDATPQAIRDRAQEIIDSVPDPCDVLLGMPQLTITPSDVSDIYPDQATQTFTVTARQGDGPVEGLLVSLAVTPETGFSLGDATVTTGEDGTATFTVTADEPGSVEIQAEATFTLPTGTMFSPVDGEGQRLVLGELTSGSVFADATATWVSGGTIVGHVFHDRNMNGVQEEGEEGLTDWNVTLYDAGGSELETGLTSGAAGNYLFEGVDDNGLEAGTYDVSVTDQEGYQRTTDAQVTVTLAMGGHGVANFGVVKLPVVQVCKYNDLNENGIRDEGESWLSGWEMQLYEGDDDSQVISGHGFTGDDGCVALGFFDDSYYEPGESYYVGETLKEGWFNVSPITQTFDLNANEVESVHFGNVAPAPAISLQESGPAYAYENQTITYVLTVTNQGNVKLTGSVSDPLLPDLDCSFEALAAGQNQVCSGTYIVPEGGDDPLLSSASVSAEDAYGHAVGDDDGHSVDVLHPAIDVAVTVSPTTVHAGDEVAWQIVVTNGGDDPLTGVTLSDDNGHDYGAPFDLDVGASRSFAYATHPTDDVTNEVSGSGSDSLGNPVTDSDAAAVAVLKPAIEVLQSTSSGMVPQGDPVQWTLVVYNRGNTPLEDVTVSDDNGQSFGPLSLTADDGDDEGGTDQASWTYTTYPEEDVTNVALGSGRDALGLEVSDDATATVEVTTGAGEGGDDGGGDGTPGYEDTDSDGDGIPDEVEGSDDADGDGTPNYLDTDSDGDGIPDEVEGSDDADGDGTPNFLDLDSDGDGIPDAVEGADDADGDGTPNFLDLDSDGDGIPDAVEGADDADGDGTPNFLDLDSDGDGIPDAVEGADDADGDGTPNFLDLDSDGDGIPDAVEGTGDADEDDVPNFLDLDSDGDGIPDSVEAGDNPGVPVDSDEDGKPDYLDLDSDGDNIPDAGEWSEGDDDPLAGCSAEEPVCYDNDADGDGTPNYLDLDSDGDGIPDSEEGLKDGDEDGVPDWLDPQPVVEDDPYIIFLPLVSGGK